MTYQRPLWELAKTSLKPQENSYEFYTFLKQNSNKSKHRQLINPKQYYLRLSIVLIILQLQILDNSIWLQLYFIIKLIYLFRLKITKDIIIDSIFLFLYLLLFPYILSMIPFYQSICWTISILFFFGGVTQKYLVLHLMIPNSISIIRLFLLIIFSLGKIKKQSQFPEIFIVIDLIAFLLFGKFKYFAFTVTVILTVLMICQIDKNLVYRKKKYSHLFEIAQVKEYH